MFVIFTCDEWKSYSSFKLVGVFTTEKKLKSGVCKLFKEDHCNVFGLSLDDAKQQNLINDTIKRINNSNVKNLIESIEYAYIQEVEKNVLEI